MTKKTPLSEIFKKSREKNHKNRFITRIEIATRVPEKFRLIDLETGEVWKMGKRSFAYSVVHGDRIDTTTWIRADDTTFQFDWIRYVPRSRPKKVK